MDAAYRAGLVREGRVRREAVDRHDAVAIREPQQKLVRAEIDRGDPLGRGCGRRRQRAKHCDDECRGHP